LEEVARLADRITVLRDGRRVGHGPAVATDRAGLIRAMVGRDVLDPGRKRADGSVSERIERPVLRTNHVQDARGRFWNVQLDVDAGEILGLYGLVGAGRSEWAQGVYGLRRLASGSIELDGRPVSIRRPAEAVRV